MKTIYIHIGLHKTGTTTIQNYLLQNSEFLGELGLLVPFKHRNHNLTYWVNGKKNTERRNKQWERLLKKIERSDHDKVVLSSEFFSRDISEVDGWYDQFQLLVEKGFKLQFILYTRRADKRFESLFIEAVKGGAAYKTIEKFPFERFIDISQLTDAIVQRFGTSSIIVRKFEDEIKRGLLAGFLEILGLKNLTIDEGFYQANTKPRLDQLRAVIHATSVYNPLIRPFFSVERQRRKALKRWVSWFVEKTKDWEDQRNYTLLPPAIAQQILSDQFQISKKVADEFFEGNLEHLYTEELPIYEVATLEIAKMATPHLIETLQLLAHVNPILESLRSEEPIDEDNLQND
jgi:hypothetical protein